MFKEAEITRVLEAHISALHAKFGGGVIIIITQEHKDGDYVMSGNAVRDADHFHMMMDTTDEEYNLKHKDK
jgi:hypothetical protein